MHCAPTAGRPADATVPDHERADLPGARVALGLGLTGLAAFLWSLRSGQYDDIDGAALRILPDDDLEG
jgi:cbb3-type cytochrome oxidase maturation protein